MKQGEGNRACKLNVRLFVYIFFISYHSCTAHQEGLCHQQQHHNALE